MKRWSPGRCLLPSGIAEPLKEDQPDDEHTQVNRVGQEWVCGGLGEDEKGRQEERVCLAGASESNGSDKFVESQ
jgi:hypothetical protein